MSDDSASRTEEPTARRLKRARDEGQVARSVELSAASVMLAATLMFFTMGGAWIKLISIYFAAGFTFDRKLIETPALLPAAFASQLMHAFFLVLPVMLLTMAVGVMASGAIGGYHFSLGAVLPKFSKLSPIAGFKKMFGTTAAVELLKSILKFTLVTSVLILLINYHFSE